VCVHRFERVLDKFREFRRNVIILGNVDTGSLLQQTSKRAKAKNRRFTSLNADDNVVCRLQLPTNTLIDYS